MVYVSDQGWQLAAGVHLAVGEQRDKVECGPASVTCASPAQWQPLLPGKQIEEVVFDRGGNLYHGRVKALSDGAREGGLKF